MLTAEQLGLDVPLLYTGACAAPAIVDSVGEAAQGAIFNLEAELGPEHPDNVMYQEIAHKYGARHDYEWQSAGTVSFRAAINLYAALRDIGADRLSRGAVLERFRSAQDSPSFFGHPYTCDGEQLRGYPALCSPQQTLGQLKGTRLEAVTDWLDVGAFAG
jgi:branched-chain amino acid transport system substrate-binding protein